MKIVLIIVAGRCPHVLEVFESLRWHSLVSKQANSRVNKICFDSLASHPRFYETNEMRPTLRPNAAALSRSLYRQEPRIPYAAFRYAVQELKENCTMKPHCQRRHLPKSDAEHDLHPLVHVEARRDHGHDFHVPNA
jgi:hypothetical protein